MNSVNDFLKKLTPENEKILQRFTQIYQSIFHEGSLKYPGSLLQYAAAKFPAKTALICKDERINFSDLYKKAVGLSEKLSDMGIGVDDRICLFFENSIEYYVAYYGIWQTGAVVVPLNTFFSEYELNYVLQDCKPKLIITSTQLQEKVARANADGVAIITEQDFPDPSENIFSIPAIDANRMAALLYTSGTTGLAKGVMLSSQNIMTNVAQVVACADVVGNDRLFAVLPLFHSFAQNTCVWSNVFLGVTTIVVPRIERHYIQHGLTHKPTIMVGVPAFYGLLCLMKKASFDHVRYFLSGGDALPSKIQVAFQLIYRRKICNGYGLTETSPFIAAHLRDEVVPSHVVGMLAPGIDCKLVDEEGKAVGPHEIGILCVKGDNIMLGYYNAPDATNEVLDSDGWFNTGDFATFDAQGRLAICGRFKDLISNKGLKIYPQEVENIIMMHPEVLKVGVVGKPDPDAGEIPVAFVMVKQETPHLEHELKQLCAKHLAPYKVPRKFIIAKELPMTATAKVNKKLLRKQLAQHND